MPDNDILQGFQVGFQSSLQMQQLRSQNSLRRLQEQQAVQEMTLKMQQNDLAIQYRADMAKAVSAAQMASSRTVLVPGPTGEGTFEVENPQPLSPDQAAFQFILPTVAKYEPDKVPQVLQNIATAQYRDQSAASLVQQRQSSIKVNEARVNEINARIANLQKGKTGVDPEWVRNVQFMEQRRGTPYTPEELDTMFNIHMGVEPRAGVPRPEETEQQFISRQLPSVRRAERSELKTKYKTDDELIDDLRKTFRTIKGGASSTNQPLGKDEVIRITEGGKKAVFNSLTKQFIRYAD